MPYFKKNNDLTATHKITFSSINTPKWKEIICVSVCFLTLPIW